MSKGIGLLLFTDGGTSCKDISHLTESVSWKGRKGSAARSITVTLIDDNGYHHERSGIDVEKGCQCIFSYDDEELFRGIIMQQKQSNRKKLEFTAYDNGIYLSNNKDTFCYENKTATEIFVDICTRFELPTDEVSKCTYVIPELTKSKTTAFDAVCDALSLDFENTGVRHYISSGKGKLSLKTRRENILQWVLETTSNISGYTLTKSIEDIKTRIKLYSDENTVAAEATKDELEKVIGIFQGVDSCDETLNEGQINDLVKSMMEEKSTPERSINIDCLGITEVISGIGVFVIIPHLDINGTYYVDEDTHKFSGRSHTMSVKLNVASDVGKDDSGAVQQSDDYVTGDIVMFNGGNHYVSSSTGSPTGGTRKGGLATITIIAKGAKHPYHLIGGAYNSLDGDCNVYGWVDAGTFTKEG